MYTYFLIRILENRTIAQSTATLVVFLTFATALSPLVSTSDRTTAKSICSTYGRSNFPKFRGHFANATFCPHQITLDGSDICANKTASTRKDWLDNSTAVAQSILKINVPCFYTIFSDVSVSVFGGSWRFFHFS